MLDLKKAREATRGTVGEKTTSVISQADIAQHLNITQGQVSKYEANPDTVPLGLLLDWLKFLGLTYETAAKFFGQEEETTSLDPGDEACREFLVKKQLLLAYLDTEPVVCPDQIAKEYTPKFIRSKISGGPKIPNLIYAGMFDSGKSRMINEFLGQSILPEGYQPETQINHILLHSSAKPAGMEENAIILKAGFDLDRSKDIDHLLEYKVIMGDYSILKEYGSHKGGKKGGESALVFVDAPILKVCNIIDTPGDLHDNDDTSTASKAIASADIVIIPSSANGFLNGPEIGYIDNIIRRLPAPDAIDPDFPTLGNLFIVATHAAPSINDEQLQSITQVGTARLWNILGESSLAERAENTGRDIDEECLRGRVFTFYAESAKRRIRLETALVEILGRAFPKVLDLSVFRLIEEIKEGTNGYYDTQISFYQQAVKDRDTAKIKLRQLKEGDAEFKKNLAAEEKDVLSLIREKKVSMSSFIDGLYKEIVNSDYVEKLIESKYGKRKKEAQEYITQNVLAQLQTSIGRKTKEASEELSSKIEKYLSSFDFLSEDESLGSQTAEIPFNARGALLGGMAGMAGVGALALWASTLGNLGAYIIAAKGASVLAALGIGLSGGSAAVTTALAAIGGPVTIGIGLIVGAVLLGWALFGDSWQRRLAKNVVKQFEKEGVVGSLKDGSNKFWEQTKEAFEKGAAAVRAGYDQNIADLDKRINDPEFTIEKMEELVDILGKTKGFLANMPWKAGR